jgi:hypothetical protein
MLAIRAATPTFSVTLCPFMCRVHAAAAFLSSMQQLKSGPNSLVLHGSSSLLERTHSGELRRLSAP